MKMPDSSRFNLSRIAIENPAITVYLLIVLLLAGVASYFQLGQDEDPPFTFRVMVVRAFWPGATALQMSEQVTDKLEETLQEVPYMDKIRSYSKAGETTIFIEVKDSAPPADIANIWYTIRKKTGDMKTRLPAGVQGPFYNDEFGDVFGVIYALSADGFSYAELKEHADEVRQELLRVPNVAKVEQYGVQKEQIFVEVSQKKLARMGIDMRQVINALNQQNAVEYAGVLRTPNDDIQIRITGQFDSIDDLKKLPLRFNNRNFNLGDIAHVERGYQDPPAPKVRHNGKEVIALGISMARGGDIIALGKDLALASQKLRATLPAGIELAQVQDQPKSVSRSVHEFIQTLAEALIIVLAVSFLALGIHTKPWRIDLRPGLVVGLSIPTVLAITFLIMERWGIDLHKISLGSLIIALGLLVDDAIIVVEMTVRKLEEGYDRLTASIHAYTTTAMPMLTGTLITATGFLPIGLANSAVGEYTFAIFAVTSTALIVSWFVSVYFVPFLGYRLLKEHPKGTAEHIEVFDSAFYNAVRRTVAWCVNYRWITLTATIGALAIGIFGMKLVEKQFFPDSNRPEILVDLWLPEGTSLPNTEALVKKVEDRLLKIPEAGEITSFVGQGVPRFYLSLDQIFPQNNVAQLVLVTPSLEAREQIRKKLPTILQEEFPEIRSRTRLLPNGPPVPYPVMFRVIGDNPQQLRILADQVKAIVRADPAMRGINDNWSEEVKSLHLDVDQDRARALGVTTEAMATASQTILSGLPIGQYREDNEQIPIMLRQPKEERDTITALTNTYIPTTNGQSIPLSQVARSTLQWEHGVVWRQDRKFSITVQGDVADGIQPATVALRINDKIDALRSKLDVGYRIEIAGTVAESQKGTSSISANVPLMLFIIFTLLMLQLRSFPRALLVFLTGPLGVIGAALMMLAVGKPMGFVAMLGIIALNGMIIRNSVILIDQIEQDIANGVERWTAVVESAVRRFRPIILTAAAAVLAMIPLMSSPFWGPMAVAIMGGLIVATALTLLSLPAMYAIFFSVKKVA
ncbi:efflux RND transporter permease subunit [Moraxellaceae bacterium AER2_44_116]|nr:efflux RND transporter permease subunit [Moraxellaceae bacterium AER2_44_116]